MSKPPLGLIPEIIDHTGTRHRWDSVSAADTPQQIGFRTLRGTGFSDMPGITLSRDIKRDYVDVQLLHEINLIGEDGSVAYEGRITAAPRSLDAGHSVVVQGAGWMAHAQDVPITYLGVDQDFGAWGEIPLAEKINLASLSEDIATLTWAVNGADGLALAYPEGTLGANATAEIWYAGPPGQKVAKLMYNGANVGVTGDGIIGLSDTDSSSGVTTYTPTLDGTLRRLTPTDALQNVFIRALPRSGAVIGAGWLRHFTKLAVYGDHGLTTRPALDSSMPDGLPLSFPCTLDDALQLGRAALAEANQPTGSGTITVSGYIRDSAGHLQQTFKPRAGDTIQIEDHPNSRPRLITETNYSHGQGTTPPSVTLALDSTMKRLDALFDRIATSQAAHNLS
jgi:hypothetical protein